MALSAAGAYLTHQQKVLRLYKRALRHLESWCIHRWERGTRGGGRQRRGAGCEAPRERAAQGLWGRMGRRPPRASRSRSWGLHSNPVCAACSELEGQPEWMKDPAPTKQSPCSRGSFLGGAGEDVKALPNGK